MAEIAENLFGDGAETGGDSFGHHSTGILPSHVRRRLIRARREIVAVEEIDEAQLQPACLDLRLGSMA